MKTKWVAFIFNNEAWSVMVKEAIASIGVKDFATLVGVDVSTATRWARGGTNVDHPYPSMSNFLIVCNLMDRYPSDFFTTGE